MRMMWLHQTLFRQDVCAHTVNNTEYLSPRMLLSSGMPQSIWGWLTDTSTVHTLLVLEVDKARYANLDRLVTKKNQKKESFHLNRIILRLGILRWGRWKTLSGSFNKGCEWQTYMTVGGWQNISFWFFTGELWNKQQAEKLNYKAKKKKAMSMTWPRARRRRGPKKTVE